MPSVYIPSNIPYQYHSHISYSTFVLGEFYKNNLNPLNPKVNIFVCRINSEHKYIRKHEYSYSTLAMLAILTDTPAKSNELAGIRSQPTYYFDDMTVKYTVKEDKCGTHLRHKLRAMCCVTYPMSPLLPGPPNPKSICTPPVLPLAAPYGTTTTLYPLPATLIW